MQQKDYIKQYLKDNFQEIQEARKLNGFSWKPILQKIVDTFPDSNLDINNEVHRERVRNNFLTLRKTYSPHVSAVSEALTNNPKSKDSKYDSVDTSTKPSAEPKT